MSKYLLPLLFFLVSVTSTFAQPVIRSFSPLSDTVGGIVTIQGSGFDGSPGNNIVYFGAVRATVSSATGTSLAVKVPSGATYQPISVTVNHLTAYSAQQFIAIYSNPYIGFDSAYFSPYNSKLNISGGVQSLFADIDGDGKPDMVELSPTSLSVCLNTSTQGNIQFAAKQDFVAGSSPKKFAISDIDGDGRLDIVTINGVNNIYVLINNSIPGSVSFTKTEISGVSVPNAISIADIDNDGRPDLIVANTTVSTISVFRNTSSGGIVSFADRVDLSSTLGPQSIVTGDIDGDGLIDVVFASNFTSSVTVVRNLSTAGTISFSPGSTFRTDVNIVPTSVAIGDLDNDGKPDLVAGASDASVIAVFKNQSTAGTISFSFPTDYSVLSHDSYTIAIGDLDGDSKPDIAVSSRNYSTLSIFKNISTGNSISLALKLSTSAASGSIGATIADIDGDGKSDLAISASDNDNAYILRNTAGAPRIGYFSPGSGTAGDLITIHGWYFKGATSVTLGGAPAYSFTIIDSSTIIAGVANPGTGPTDSISITTSLGVATIGGFTRLPAATITSFTPTAAHTGETITIHGESLSNTRSVSFGGTAAASFKIIDANTVTAVVGNGATGDVTVNISSLPGFSFIPPPAITGFTPTSATTGDTLTIAGTNLSDVTEVSIGGIPALSFKIESSTNIKAVVLSGSSGIISVRSKFGTSTLSGFTFIPPPLPIITSFSPSPAAIGDTITIQGSYFLGASSIGFGGQPARSFTVVSPTLILAVIDTGLAGSISITTPGGTTTVSGFQFIPPPVITSFSPIKGGNSTIVTITGHSLSDASSVIIGGSPAQSFTVLSSTTISAVVGNTDPGRTDITVTTPYGSDTVKGFYSGPFITSFTPASGPVGTQITISGANFSSILSENNVFFGGIKANVLTASGTTLKVEVPAGAISALITVQTKGLSASTSQPFTITFTGIGETFMPSSFASHPNIPGEMNPDEVIIDDFDGDGKEDITMVNFSSTYFSVFRNNSSNGTFSLESKKNFSVDPDCTHMTSGDLDGDGKPEVLVSNDMNSILIFRNNSTKGTVSFAPRMNITVNAGVVAVKDLDGDGRQDIIVADLDSIYLVRNTSTPGSLSFESPVSYPAGPNTQGIFIGDLNGDDKPDITVANSGGGSIPSSISIFKNNSVAGESFSSSSLTKKSYTTGANKQTYALVMGDVDGDGKMDIAYANAGDNTVFILRNTGMADSISFVASGVFAAGNYARTICLHDMDGDGRPDMLVGAFYTGAISVFKNKSTAGTISFSPKFDYSVNDELTSICITDIDGDGKPDIAGSNYGGDALSLFRNRVGEPGIMAFGSIPVTENVINTVYLDPTLQTYNGSPYVQRHYDIDPSATSLTKATVTLYFTQTEFDNFNSFPGHGKDLPKSANDSTGMAAIRIFEFYGLSSSGLPGSYPGTGTVITPDASHISWNDSAKWWQVTFDVSALGGFFLSNSDAKLINVTTGVINIDNSHYIKLFPNPVDNQMILTFKLADPTTVTVQLIDMNGKIYLIKEGLSSGSILNTSRLAKGLYFARIYTDINKAPYTIKVLKL